MKTPSFQKSVRKMIFNRLASTIIALVARILARAWGRPRSSRLSILVSLAG